MSDKDIDWDSLPDAPDSKKTDDGGVDWDSLPDAPAPAQDADQQDWQNKPNLSPLEVAGYAGADALRRASMVINPAFKAAGLAGAALRTGATAVMSGVDRTLENYSADRPITEGVGTAMGIGGGINAGLEAAVTSAIPAGKLAMKGGRWVMDQAAETLFGGKLTQEMLQSPTVQEAINKIVSLKGAMGFGKNLKRRADAIADDAAKAYTKAVGNIPDEAIPISTVLPEDVLQNLDVNTLDNSIRSQLPNYRKKIVENLEPTRFQNSREARQKAIRDSILAKRGELDLQTNLAEREARALAEKQAPDLAAAQQLDQEQAAKMFMSEEGIPEGQISSLTDEVSNQLKAKQSELSGRLGEYTDQTNAEIQSLQRSLEAPAQRETTLREAYNVANTPMKGDINPLTDTLGANVRSLGGESVAAADAAKSNMEDLNDLAASTGRQDGSLKSIVNNILRWGGRAAAITHPMAWATAEVATNPELRYVLGRNLEAIGKWSPKLQEAYAAGGAKAVNVLVNTLNQTDPEFRQAHAGNQQVSPYQEGAEKPQIKKPELSRQDFLKNLGGVESAGKYDATNPNSSATGKYQFLWKTWGDDVSKWAGAPISQQMFLRTPALQDAYMKHHHDTTLMQGAKTLRSTSPNAANRSDTELKALIHFKGLEGAKKYLDTGADDTSANNMNVEDYIKRVGGGA